MAAKISTLWNGNQMAVVDVETTGLEAGFNDIIQVCVLPLNADFAPCQAPFYQEMQPKRPENISEKAMSVSKIKLHELMARAMEADRVADYFDEWFRNLGLPTGKRLIPLAHNWPFDRAFMVDWLGPLHMDEYFTSHYRDTLATASYLNDWADFHAETFPFPDTLKLGAVGSRLGITLDRAHDALEDCKTTAAIYRKMIRGFSL